ncbi:MAG: hypothetical protein HY819_20420 [Acidobacteria bacterium]|nr:hypothetical protein [Acidobacteriota bacterium]
MNYIKVFLNISIIFIIIVLFTPNIVAQTQLGSWSRTRPVNDARQEVGVAELNGKIYLIGGFRTSSSGRLEVATTVEVYDPKTDQWSFVAPLPEPLHHTTAVSLAGRVYVIGGYNTLSFNPVASAYRYDPQANQWTKIANLPTRRGALATVVIGNLIYSVGGEDTSATGDLASYDPTTNRWTNLATMPTPREHITAGVINGKIYVAGGRNPSSFTLNILEEYDPIANSWQTRAPMPTGRSGIAGEVVNGRFYVFGGEGNVRSGTGTFAENESYDPITNTWRSEVPMPTPRHGIGAAVIENKIYIPSGAPVQGFGLTSLSEVYTVNNMLPANRPPVIESITSQMLRGGEEKCIDIKVTDPDGDMVTTLCDTTNPRFVVCGQNRICLTPTSNDNGDFNACVIARDSFGNETKQCFSITIINNRAPFLAPFPEDFTVKELETFTIDFRANDPDISRDPNGDGKVILTLTQFPEDPPFVILKDDGNGKGTITITPPAGAGGDFMRGYLVKVIASDNGTPSLSTEKSFSFKVSSVPQIKPPSINGASFNAKKLTIVGQNFSPSPIIEINGQQIDNNRVSLQNDSQIILAGNRKKLALKLGTNQIVIIVNGVRSTPFNLSIN